MDFYKKETNIFYIYFQIIKKYKLYMEKELSSYRLTPSEIDVLSFLVNNQSREITSKDIGDYRGISKGLVSKSVNSLIEKDILSTRVNKEDRRSLYLVINNKESTLIKDIERANHLFVGQILKNIKSEDIERLLATNTAMLENIRDI